MDKTLIVGIGNWESKYLLTRHNIGWEFTKSYFEYLKINSDWSIVKDFSLQKDIAGEMAILSDEKQRLYFLLPHTYMNESGVSVQKLLQMYKLDKSNLVVCHDDLDIRLGEFKYDFAKGPKVHGGINSIETHLSTKNFYRLRIGIENRKPENKIEGKEYVLQNFTSEELTILKAQQPTIFGLLSESYLKSK